MIRRSIYFVGTKTNEATMPSADIAAWYLANKAAFPVGHTFVDVDTTVEDQRAMAASIVQRHLDSLAAEWGYDDIHTLIGAWRSSIPQIAAEANAGQAFYDACWEYARTYGGPMDAGAFRAGLPVVPSRPS